MSWEDSHVFCGGETGVGKFTTYAYTSSQKEEATCIDLVGKEKEFWKILRRGENMGVR